LLVPFNESNALAQATLRFLGDPELRQATQARAYEYARPMFWPNVGRQYLKLFNRVVRTSQEASPAPFFHGMAAVPAALGQPASLLPGGV
jgi:hypothetical protein